MPYNRVDTLIAARTKILLDAYKKAAKHLDAIARDTASTSFQRWRAEQLLSQVRKEVRALNEIAIQWSAKNIPKIYKTAGLEAAELIPSTGYRPDFGTVLNKSAIDALSGDMAADLITANNSIRMKFERFIRATQQTVLQDKAISERILGGLIEGETAQGVAHEIFKDLQDAIGEGKFITINGRNYDPESYAELVTRTRTREAVTQGILNTCIDAGIDLVRWSEHEDSCPLCEVYQGKIYSISGKDKKYPKLVALPPLHPNCRHVLVPYVEIPEARKKGTPEQKELDRSRMPGVAVNTTRATDQSLKFFYDATTLDALFYADMEMRSKLAKVGVDAETFSYVKRCWNMASNSAETIAFQWAAGEELGASFSPWQQKNKIERFGIKRPKNIAEYRRMARVIYDETQKKLRDAGVTELVVFRGEKSATGDLAGRELTRVGNLLESWSLNPKSASDTFGTGQGCFAMKVPAERVFSFRATGPGVSSEYEFLLLGGVEDNVSFVVTD